MSIHNYYEVHKVMDMALILEPCSYLALILEQATMSTWKNLLIKLFQLLQKSVFIYLL